MYFAGDWCCWWPCSVVYWYRERVCSVVPVVCNKESFHMVSGCNVTVCGWKWMYFRYNLDHRPMIVIAGIVMSVLCIRLCGLCFASFKGDFTAELVTSLLYLILCLGIVGQFICIMKCSWQFVCPSWVVHERFRPTDDVSIQCLLLAVINVLHVCDY
jgi:hypothetical protein